MRYSVVITDLYDHRRVKVVDVAEGQNIERVALGMMSDMDAFADWTVIAEDKRAEVGS